MLFHPTKALITPFANNANVNTFLVRHTTVKLKGREIQNARAKIIKLQIEMKKNSVIQYVF
jgi:hypothetical protein